MTVPEEPAPRSPPPSRAYLVIGRLTRRPAALLFRTRWRGVENAPDGGCFIAPSHISSLDVWAVGLPLFPRRYLRFMAKAELFKPLLGPVIRAAGAFRVRRGEHDRAAIETAVELCRQGHAVVIFPEGTRRKKGVRKKWRPRAHTGAARVALAAEVPLIPVGIAGTDRLTRLGPVRVAFGPPVALSDLGERGDRQAAELATERLMAAIFELEAAL